MRCSHPLYLTSKTLQNTNTEEEQNTPTLRNTINSKLYYRKVTEYYDRFEEGVTP